MLAFSLSSAWADDYDDTIAVFKKAGDSGSYFEKSYGYAVFRYAVFPTIGKGGDIWRAARLRLAKVSVPTV